MVHRKADTNHGGANIPCGEDGEEPVERPWGNPTTPRKAEFLLP